MLLSLFVTINSALAGGGYYDNGGCEFSPGSCLCLGLCAVVALLALSRS